MEYFRDVSPSLLASSSTAQFMNILIVFLHDIIIILHFREVILIVQIFGNIVKLETSDNYSRGLLQGKAHFVL